MYEPAQAQGDFRLQYENTARSGLLNHAVEEWRVADKHHAHMNATKWETLTNFVKYLGKSGQCVVDETEKGWYIAWVDRTLLLSRGRRQWTKAKHEMDDEERARRELKRQVKAAGGVKEVQADAVDLSKGVCSFGLAAAEKPPR